MLKWIDKYLKYYKIGSGDLTAYPIIENLTKREKPIILSTGLSNLREIKDTIELCDLLYDVRHHILNIYEVVHYIV